MRQYCKKTSTTPSCEGSRPDRPAVRPVAWPGRLVRLETAESTNSSALRLAGGSQGDDFAVVAEEQTAGRGRLGRSWISPKGGGLYCSVALRPAAEPGRWPQLTLVMAVAAVEAIAAATGARLAIKWPNDLYFDGRKVGGILAEVRPDPDGGSGAVTVGIGINLSHRRADFAADLVDTIDSIAGITGLDPDGELLLCSLLDHFHVWRLLWEEEGFAPVRARWLEYDCTVGKRVTLRGVDDTKVLVEDIDVEGWLLVRDGSGKRHRVVADDILLDGREVDTGNPRED